MEIHAMSSSYGSSKEHKRSVSLIVSSLNLRRSKEFILFTEYNKGIFLWIFGYFQYCQESKELVIWAM